MEGEQQIEEGNAKNGKCDIDDGSKRSSSEADLQGSIVVVA